MTAVQRSTRMINMDRTEPAACPVCDEGRRAYMFIVRGLPVARCPGCGLISVYPAPAAEDLRTFYRDAPEPMAGEAAQSSTEAEAAGRYIKRLAQRGVTSGRLLVAGPQSGAFAEAARAAGFEVTAWDGAADLEGPFAAAVLLHELQRSKAPAELLSDVYDALEDGGVLFLTAPSVDSWLAKFLKHQWTEYRPENRYYFSPNTLQMLLLKSGFAKVERTTDRRKYTLQHIYDRAKRAPQTFFTRMVRLGYRVMPPLRGARFRVTSSAMVVSAVKMTKRERPLVSIVLPVFNERETFKTLMDTLLERTIPGVDREIIVVESNSKDGTREVAQSYQGHPEVRIILQDKPRGKGHAVREGFFAARGDILLIQDADLEYDLNDYDQLLEPLLAHREMFILGARHGGSWKMRQFADQSNLSTMLNFGHIFFCGLMNVLFHQNMKDPFTMYKVLRRDCLHGLYFECNKFDFDHELVIKLCLKGYSPLELPVNYVSRSFKEGKKVSIFGEPPRWLRINFKLWWCGLKRGRKGTPAIDPAA